MSKNKKKDKQIQPEYQTLAMADNSSQDPKTGVTMPSKEAVNRTRDWSQENKK